MDDDCSEKVAQARQTYYEGDKDRAMDEFRAILEKYPTDYQAPNWLAYLLDEKGAREEALKYAELSVKVAPFEPSPTFTYVSILIGLERYFDARVQLELLRSLDRSLRYKALALDHFSTIYSIAMKSAVKLVHSLRRGQCIDVVLPSVALSASLILGDTIKDCRIISDAESTWIYKLTGVADNYQLWLTEDNEMSIIIDNPASDLHQHTIFSGSYSTDDENGVLTHSQDPRVRGDEFKQKFKGESQFFAAIVSISDMIRKDPDRLFYVEHGLDSGEWGPEEEYSLSDYQKILNQVEGAAYGYQINFEVETWWGWVSGRSNPGSGAWIEGEGSEEFIARVKRAIHRTSSRP